MASSSDILSEDDVFAADMYFQNIIQSLNAIKYNMTHYMTLFIHESQHLL